MNFFERMFTSEKRSDRAKVKAPTRSVEDAAKEVLSVWKEHELFFWYDPANPKDTKTCFSPNCHRHYQTTGNKILMRNVEGGLACSSCGKTLVFQDYWFDGKNGFKHKLVRDIGQGLSDVGGIEAMRRVASRFVALGGKSSDLSHCWDGVGSWLN